MHPHSCYRACRMPHRHHAKIQVPWGDNFWELRILAEASRYSLIEYVLMRLSSLWGCSWSCIRFTLGRGKVAFATGVRSSTAALGHHTLKMESGTLAVRGENCGSSGLGQLQPQGRHIPSSCRRAQRGSSFGGHGFLCMQAKPDVWMASSA